MVERSTENRKVTGSTPVGATVPLRSFYIGEGLSFSLTGRWLDADDANVDQGEVDAAWRVELRRRIDDIESGKAELLDVDESHAQLRAELAARRA